MIPILSHGPTGEKGYTYRSFEENFISICEAHRRENRALAFAIILHDFTHPQVAKVLGDRDYWKALDVIAGKYLSVFSFHTVQRKPIADDGITMHWMVGVFQDQLEKPEDFVQKHFKLADVFLPAILFFQVFEEKISGFRIVELTQTRQEESFLEIKKILGEAADAVSEVDEKNYGNSIEIFDLIERKLRDRGIKLKIIKWAKRALKIQEISKLLNVF